MCKSSTPCVIRSSQVSLSLLLLIFPSTVRLSTALTDDIVCLLFTYLNHLSLTSLILSAILATPKLFLNTSFFIWSTLVYLYIYFSIFISARATSIFYKPKENSTRKHLLQHKFMTWESKLCCSAMHVVRSDAMMSITILWNHETSIAFVPYNPTSKINVYFQ